MPKAATVSFSRARFATIVASAALLALGYALSAPGLVIGAGQPKLTLSPAPVSFQAGQTSSVITVSRSDDDAPLTSGALVVTLSSDSPGSHTFYDNTGNATATVTIPDGASSTTFTYSDNSTIGTQIVASASGHTSATATLSVSPAALGAFTISASTPTTVVAGVAFSVDVTARDVYENVKADYTGTVTLTGSKDGPGCSAAVCGGTGIPVVSKVEGTPGTWNAGVKRFSAIKTFATGSTSYTASDGDAITGTRDYNVDPSPNLGAFNLGSPASTPVAGTAFSLAVTAYDEFGNIKTNYTGAAALTGAQGAPGCSAAVCGTALPNSSVSANNGSVGSWTNGTSTISGIKTYKTVSTTLSTTTAPSNNVTFTPDPAALGGFSISSPITAPVGDPVIAGVPFDVNVTAYDLFGNIKTDYAGPWRLTDLATSPGSPVAAATAPDYANAGTPTNGSVAFNGTKAYFAGSNTLTVDNSPSADPVSNSRTFTVKYASAHDLLFQQDANVGFAGAQPIDTKVASKIYSLCSPAVATDPCAAPPASKPVKVLAIDSFGNRVPGYTFSITSAAATGGTNPIVALQGSPVSGTTSNGTDVQDTVTIPYGEAWFNNLVIPTISSGQTDKYTLAAAGAGASGSSGSFRIVSDLAQCNNVSQCTNRTTNNSIEKPENSYSFVKPTVGTGVTLVETTNFSSGADVNGQCTAERGKSQTIGNAIDVRNIGIEANDPSKPATNIVMMVKQKTLQFYGVTSRSAGSFDVCMGALYLDGAATGTKVSADKVGVTGPRIWFGKDKQGKKKLAVEAPDADGLYRWWGVMADCTATFVDKTKDPCVVLKTKSAAALATQLKNSTGDTTWTVATVGTRLNFFDGDIAIVQLHAFPWDGKGGVY